MLHTICQSPYQNSDMPDCALVAQAGDDILFYQNAVIALQKGGKLEPEIIKLIDQGVTIYVLVEDCELRGVHEVLSQANRIDYVGFVKLIEKHETMYAW